MKKQASKASSQIEAHRARASKDAARIAAEWKSAKGSNEAQLKALKEAMHHIDSNVSLHI